MGLKSIIKSFFEPEDIRHSAPYSEEFYTGFRYKKHSDHLLSKMGYATNADVYALVQMIGNKMSEIPVEVKKQDLKGGYVLDENSDVYDLLHGDSFETFKEKIIKASINLNITGDLFIQKIYTVSDSFPSRLKILRSSQVHLECNWKNEVTTLRYCDHNYYINIPYDEIIHVKRYDPVNNYDHRGLSPLQAGYLALDASNDIQTASARLYKNLGASWLISDRSGTLRTEEEASALQKAINKRLGGADKAGQVTVTGIDTDVTQLGMSSKDMELMKSQPMKLRQMCNLFGVDSSFFNDPENKTFNNRKTAEKAFINNAVKPTLELILGAIERDINRDRSVILVPNYSGLDCLQEDQKERVEKNRIETESITALLTSELSNEQKIMSLIKIWGMEEEEAKLWIK